jgi:hypothetical protein
MNRIERPDIKAIATGRNRIVLSEGQMFCSTEKSFEIWDKDPLRLIYRVSRSKVFWVFGETPVF